MAKKKSTVEKVTAAVQGAASAVARAAEENVVKPVGKALGLTGGKKPAAKAGGAAKKPAAKPTAAGKVMTKGLGGKKPAAAKGAGPRVTNSAKPAQKGGGGGGGSAPRRGASKGR